MYWSVYFKGSVEHSLHKENVYWSVNTKGEDIEHSLHKESVYWSVYFKGGVEHSLHKENVYWSVDSKGGVEHRLQKLRVRIGQLIPKVRLEHNLYKVSVY